MKEGRKEGRKIKEEKRKIRKGERMCIVRLNNPNKRDRERALFSFRGQALCTRLRVAIHIL